MQQSHRDCGITSTCPKTEVNYNPASLEVKYGQLIMSTPELPLQSNSCTNFSLCKVDANPIHWPKNPSQCCIPYYKFNVLCLKLHNHEHVYSVLLNYNKCNKERRKMFRGQQGWLGRMWLSVYKSQVLLTSSWVTTTSSVLQFNLVCDIFTKNGLDGWMKMLMLHSVRWIELHCYT